MNLIITYCIQIRINKIYQMMLGIQKFPTSLFYSLLIAVSFVRARYSISVTQKNML